MNFGCRVVDEVPRSISQRLCALLLMAVTVATLAAVIAPPARASSAEGPGQGNVAFTVPVSQISSITSLTPEQLSQELASLAEHPTEVANLIGSLAKGLSPEQLEQLQGILQPVAEALSSGALSEVQSDLATLLGSLSPTTLQSILAPLEGALAGGSLTQLQDVLKEAGTLTPTQLQALLQELLGGLSPAAISEVVTRAIATLTPEQAHEALVDLLQTLPFTATTVGKLAESLGMSAENLASSLGTTAAALPEGASTLTAPLTSGRTLTLAGGPGGLSMGVLGGAEGGGSGGAGGAGSQSSGVPSLSTLVVNVPTASPARAPSKHSTRAAKRVKIVRSRRHGRKLFVTVKVSSAGRLTLSGKGLRRVSRTVTKPGRVTLRTTLTRAEMASLRRHRVHKRIKIKVTLKPKRGAASVAKRRVRLK